MVDISGHMVVHSIDKFELNTGNHTLLVLVPNMKSGTYLMKIKVDNTLYTKLVHIQ